MKGVYKIIVNGTLRVYNDYKNIPDEIDHVICFIPDFPEGPHTEEDHAVISSFAKKLQILMEREYASSN